MCEPVTLAIAGTALAVAGSAVSGYMGVQQAKGEAKIARRNATMKSAEAADAISRRDEDNQTLARKYAAIRGSQTAAMAANGVDVDFGSAGGTLQDTGMFYGEDAARLNDNADNEIRGIDISASNYRAQADAARSKATGIAVGTAFDMGSTILGGVGQTKRIRASQAGGGSGWGGF